MDKYVKENMDKILPKKKGIRKIHIPYIIGGILIFIFWGGIVFGNHNSKINIKRTDLTVTPVISGDFNDYIRISGQVMPINTIHLSVIEGGKVVEKLIEEGMSVMAGDIILRLENTNLQLDVLSSEALFVEKQNSLRNTEVSIAQEKINLRREKLQIDMDVAQKKRKFEQYDRLFSENLVSREEYLHAKENHEFAVSAYNLIVERQKQDSIFSSVRLDQIRYDLEITLKNLEIVRQRMENLNVKAPVDGQLGMLNIEIGQTISAGAQIGQISVLSDYKVEAAIDEHYIDRVRTGLDGTFERQDSSYILRVSKVSPEVRNKQFKTDFIFEGERPENIRAGQTYIINLQLGQPAEAILIPRGAFYSSTGGKWIFVIMPDGSCAVRRPIVIGRQNPNYYEVISGLEPNEQVIISGYESYGDAKELIIK